MAGFQSVVPAVVGGAVEYASNQSANRQAQADRAAQLEAARRQRAFEREQQIAARQAEIQARREERAYQRRLQLEAHQLEQQAYAQQVADQRAAEERQRAAEQAAFERELEMQRLLEREAFERELALERERTRRAREIYEAENPAVEADPGLVRERLSTLEARAEDRATRAQDLAAEQASARARAAAAGITGGGTAKAIQRNLIDRSRKSGERAETRFQIRLDEQDKRHARNLLEAENRRRRAMLGLEAQLETRV
jgi:Zn-dependent metalloprotease